MKQPTKEQLRQKNADLYSDLCNAIYNLPTGEVKDKLVEKYPFYNLCLPPPPYYKKYLEKYGNMNWVDEFIELQKLPQ